MKIKMTIAELVVFAELNDSKTARLIENALPFSAKAELWGKEVYFYITPEIGIEKEIAHDVVQEGDVAYWPQGPCMCLFFGLTPNSRDGEIMPASTVNVFGRLVGDPEVLVTVKEGQSIKIERA